MLNFVGILNVFENFACSVSQYDSEYKLVSMVYLFLIATILNVNITFKFLEKHRYTRYEQT